MSRFLQPGQAPQTDDERNALLALSHLADGQPLEAADHYSAIRPTSSIAQLLGRWVINSRDSGASSSNLARWLVAPRGGGKTETLRILQRKIGRQAARDNSAKSVVVPIDLKLPAGSLAAGLQRQIFYSCMMTDSSFLSSDIESATKRLLAQSDLSSTTGTTVGLGLDLAVAFSGVPAPGLSLLGTSVFRRLWRWLKFRRTSVEKIVQRAGVSSTDAIELFTSWIMFAVKPCEGTYRELEDVLNRSAERGDLFHSLCHGLEAAGYSTIILLVDEADELSEARGLTKAFERLWDRPPEGSKIGHRLDMAFIMAISGGVESLADEDEHGGFSRRFFGPLAPGQRTLQLNPPQVSAEHGVLDDLGHAQRVIEDLLSRISFATSREPSSEEIDKAREILVEKSVSQSLTWHALWSATTSLYAQNR